jgi:hypothetical protein
MVPLVRTAYTYAVYLINEMFNRQAAVPHGDR